MLLEQDEVTPDKPDNGGRALLQHAAGKRVCRDD